MFILSLITQITQRECGRAALFRRQRQFVVNVVLGFVRVNQRDLRETLRFILCRLIEYSCVLFSRRLRRGHRERQVGEMKLTTITAVLTEIKF